MGNLIKTKTLIQFLKMDHLRTLDQKGVTILEYIWIDGSATLRGKARTIPKTVNDVSQVPEWNYDGSSCYQAETANSEVILKPVFMCPDPFRGGELGVEVSRVCSEHLFVIINIEAFDIPKPAVIGEHIPTITPDWANAGDELTLAFELICGVENLLDTTSDVGHGHPVVTEHLDEEVGGVSIRRNEDSDFGFQRYDDFAVSFDNDLIILVLVPSPTAHVCVIRVPC